MEYKGCIYTEFTPYKKASGGRKFRYVAEYQYKGKRYRFRSTNIDNVENWLIKNINKINNKPCRTTKSRKRK